MKLFKLSDDKFIIVDESGAPDSTYTRVSKNLSKSGGQLFYHDGEFVIGRVTHSTESLPKIVSDGIVKSLPGILDLDLSEVKNLIGEINLDKYKSVCGQEEFFGFKHGYKQALDDNKDKLFTFEDLMRVELCYLRECDNDIKYRGQISSRIFNEKTINKSSWDVEFVEGKLVLISQI